MSERRNYVQGEGKDWNVKETIAYGRGEVHHDFMGLQRDLNTFADKVGFEKLEVDGFIGPKSVDAWNAIYAASLAIEPLATVSFPQITVKEQLAELAQHVRHFLQSTATRVLLKPTTQA